MKRFIWLAMLSLLFLLFVNSVAGAEGPEPTWVQRWSEVSPGKRRGTVMAYDEARRVSVLFGGVHITGGEWYYLDDTWEWHGTAWIRRTPETSPPARDGHALAYDGVRGVSVLFGGLWWDEPVNDTWEWDGTAWRERIPASSPSARWGHALAYDSKRRVTVLFGGMVRTETADLSVNDTWEWDGTTWTQRSPSTAPSARAGHAMVYDSRREVTVLFGGGLDDTWEWDGTSWTKRSSENAPPRRYGHALAYDAARGVTVLFGGFGDGGLLNDTWEWDGTNWVQRIPLSSPPAIFGPAMTYDTARGFTVLFDGRCDYPCERTWEYGLHRWWFPLVLF